MKKYFCFFILIVFGALKIGAVNNNLFSFKALCKKVVLVDLQQDVLGSIHIKSKDTIVVIDALLKESDTNKNKGLYALAYEDLWKAMMLANAMNDVEKLASIHEELGVLYGIYGKLNKAIYHKKKALEYVKKSKLKNKDANNNLGGTYYSLAVQYRKTKEYDKSLAYLDSCYNLDKQKKENPYVLAEKGKIYSLQSQLNKAEPLLLKAKEIFEKSNKNYIIIIYSFLGDLYAKKNELDKALYYYEKSLKGMFVLKSHTDLKTDVLQKSAALYQKKNQLNKAFSYLKESTEIADSLFSIRSKSNSQLFEINNKYKEALVKKDAHISEQKQVIDKKKKNETRLLLVIGFILFGLMILMFTFYYKSKINKLKAEKEKNAIKIKHDKEKLNVVLETKSKELTVSALQMIEKDKNIDKLLTLIKEDKPETYRKLNKEIVGGNKDLWKSFNLRFTEVNTDFYKRLQEKHNTLTPTEQKHCALIKLKFDSKEMARLLNISVNSVHISRHRIRKKIGLQRFDDLTNYIASI